MTEKGKNTPIVRFKGFTDAWEQRKLDDVVSFYSGLTYTPNDVRKDGTLVLRSSNVKDGEIVSSDDVFVDSSKVNSNNVEEGDIIVVVRNGSRALIGKHAQIKHLMSNTVIGAFMTGIRSNVPEFINAMLDTSRFKKEIDRNMGATINQITGYMFSKMIFSVPTDDEKKKIGRFFEALDNLTVLHQRQLDEQKALKKYFLQNMFPAKGEKIPRIRFQGFTGDWEERKLGELVIIERGGSPRPIDAYITDAQDGLNWVKIGDAPEQGRYITHTEEKIKPSGLSKTRQVFQGDLILSNSMSFGKPYIMDIQGCIHDGWLLIRNNQNVFDLKFLCQMLGTEQMLAQYRQLAAGSTVNNLNKELVSNAIVKVPRKVEQEKIGTFLESIDNVIALHQRQLTQLQAVKKFMLQNLFI